MELTHRDRPVIGPSKGREYIQANQPSSFLSVKLAPQWSQFRAPIPILSPDRTQQGDLASTDPFNPSRSKRFSDTYQIQRIHLNQQIRIKVTSSTIDPFIELINAQTGDVILANDDNGRNRNSQLSFVVQPEMTYHLRVSSYARRETGDYQLTLRALTSSIQDFSFAYGHGLVDAYAAVTAAMDLGGYSKTKTLGTEDETEDDLEAVPIAPSWNLKRVNAPEVWQQGIRGKDVVVAVIDSGISVHHPDIRTNLWRNPGEIPDNGLDDDGNGFVDDGRGWDFIGDDNNPRDGNVHGTHVAGIVGARENSLGITGVAPDATIMPVRVLDRNGGGTAKGVAKGIRYAVKNGADVINLSLGVPPRHKLSRSIRRALRLAHRKGVIVAIAAGNERDRLGTARPGEPAFWAATRNLAIAVGAVNRRGEVADFSNPTGNRKVNPFVVAPGVNIESLAAVWLRNEFGPNSLELIEPLPLSGTSMATPHVAGIAALMLNANPHLAPKQAHQILSDTANPENLTPI